MAISPDLQNDTITARKDLEGGFSMLELVISMLVFTIVTAAVFGVLQIARQSRTVVSENSQLNKNVRLALNVVGRDTYNAGFGYPLFNTVILPDNRISVLLGIPNDFDTSRDTIPPIIAGNDVTINNFNQVPNTRTDQVTFLFKDSSFNLVGTPPVSQPVSISASTTTGGVDVLTVAGGNGACRVNDIYLVTGANGSTLGLATALVSPNKVHFANEVVLGLNQTGTGGPLRSITPASMQRVQMVTYYVTTDGTLMRREYANVTPAVPAVGSVDEPLVYGVENFQIRYVMDDGSITDNPSSGPNGIPGDADDTPANLAAVRQVRFTVSVRSTELNSAGQPYRISMTSTFSTRNLGYDAS